MMSLPLFSNDNLSWRTYEAHKVGFPITTEFYPYTYAKNRTPDNMFKGSKSFNTWTNPMLVPSGPFYKRQMGR